MGVLRDHHAVLRDVCLRVRQHVGRYHGGAGKRRVAGTCWERTQGGCAGRVRSTPAATCTPAGKHVHTVAHWHVSTPHAWLVCPLQTVNEFNYSFPDTLVRSFGTNRARAVSSVINPTGEDLQPHVWRPHRSSVSQKNMLHFAHCTSMKPTPPPNLVTSRGVFPGQENVLFHPKILKHIPISALGPFSHGVMLLLDVKEQRLLDSLSDGIKARVRWREK